MWQRGLAGGVDWVGERYVYEGSAESNRNALYPCMKLSKKKTNENKYKNPITVLFRLLVIFKTALAIYVLLREVEPGDTLIAGQMR